MLSKSGLLNAYWAVLAIVAILALVFKNDKKRFVISAALVHIFVCGLRYDSMHGDLLLYKRIFNDCANSEWVSTVMINSGKNTLFQMLNKAVAVTTNNNFQVLLFIISAVSVIAISIVIYKYSEMPFISYMMWSCFGFYISGFYSIKQSFAMAFVMLGSIGIFEKKPLLFYFFAIIAGFIHMPAFIFLPAYELCRTRKLRTIVYFFIILSIIVILFRNQIVNQMADLYYENDKYAAVSSYGIGGKSLMLIALATVGLLLCNMKQDKFRYTLILISTSALIQMFAVYDNVFTRLADYYFQFIIIYAPVILSQSYKNASDAPVMPFNKDSRMLITILFCIMAMVFYYRVNFLHASSIAVDNLVLNFKFFWQ